MTTPHYLYTLLATVLSAAVVPLFHVGILRITKKPQYILHWMALCFIAAMIAWLLIFSLLKQGAPMDMREWIGGFSLLGFLFLGYMEMMFKLYRGFSHTLVCDIDRLGSVTTEQIFRDFAEGAGMEVMLTRRLLTLHAEHMLVKDGLVLRLTPAGRCVAVLGRRIKHLLNLGTGG